METKLLVLLYLIFHGLRIVNGVRPNGPGNFNVMSFGARGDGLRDDSKAFQETWKAACNSTGSVKLVIPKGTYFLSPVKFRGPCANVQSITGTLKATTDLSKYRSGGYWVEFGFVDHLTVTGGGTLDGQGSLAWPTTNACEKGLQNSYLLKMKDITSVNSKFFHIALLSNANFKASGIKIVAPRSESPTPDGIHLERNTAVTSPTPRSGRATTASPSAEATTTSQSRESSAGPDMASGTERRLKIVIYEKVQELNCCDMLRIN
ncbi:Exopolygalacturonase [Ananas comosus]|uniref:Exopolygalacturonase n=1 Tax=Ananas comosus TaxID=4615 RepID=A0A199VCK2_ANACO|nr:Exopolygalacturonase [Ananas comosus]